MGVSQDLEPLLLQGVPSSALLQHLEASCLDRRVTQTLMTTADECPLIVPSRI